VVKYVNFKVYDPVYVAIENGYFEDHGIEVKIIGDVLAGPTGIQAVAGGSAHAGLSSLPAIINANASGLPIIATSDIQSAIGDQPLEVYYVRSDSGIRSIEDLRGKVVQVNLWRSSFHYTILMALDQHGMSDSEMTFVLISFDLASETLKNGEVDMIGLMEPYASYAAETYGDEFTVLFDALDIFGEAQICTHFMNRVWAEDHPEQATAFTDGIVDAILWIHGHQDEAKVIIAKYTGIPEQYVPEYWFQENGVVIMEDVQMWMDFMRERGDLTADWVTVDMIATNEYNTRAAE